MRGQLAQEQEANLRALSEQFAQRGLGGGAPAVGMAEAAQRGRIGAASAEAAFRENLQRSALQDIQAMNQELVPKRDRRIVWNDSDSTSYLNCCIT